ncbi:hypothetical protein IWQ62_005203 [Dispira parvispora]|uniref:Uncharacterized protein n=1 Tax=Dispira parvispora TaxID=1520584 RepID=A0A9W8ARF8_9FUNG|nr:hypothetical protein IWQ62_005203 [Dispira parvispora]
MAGAFSQEAMESRLRDPLARLGDDLLDIVKSVLAPHALGSITFLLTNRRGLQQQALMGLFF